MPATATTTTPGTITQPLYQISGEMMAIFLQIEQAADEHTDGEIPPDMAARLDELQLGFEAKADGIVRRLAVLAARKAAAQGYLDGIMVEANRLKALVDRFQRKHEWLKEYLHRSMTTVGMTKIETETHTITVQKNGRPSITLPEGAEIPEDYRKEKITVSFDSQRAYEDWKNQVELPPAVQVVQGTHLRIR